MGGAEETHRSLLGGSDMASTLWVETCVNQAKSDRKFIGTGPCRIAAMASM
jgi:hypothetical protein